MAESTQRLSDYEKSQARYQDLLSGSSKFKDMVEQQIKEKTNYNKDLIGQQQRLIENQLSLPSQLRSEFSGGPIRDPLAQEALIQQRSSNVGQQLGSVGNLLSARNQDQSSLMQKALESYQSTLSGEQTAAENAWRLYQDALAREEAAKARAAASQPAFDLSSLFNNAGGSSTGGGGEPVYEIEDPNHPSNFGTASLTDSYQDRLAKQVLDQRKAQTFGDVAKSYFNTSLEPLRNIKSFSDVASIPTRGIGATTTIYSDLLKRLFK